MAVFTWKVLLPLNTFQAHCGQIQYYLVRYVHVQAVPYVCPFRSNSLTHLTGNINTTPMFDNIDLDDYFVLNWRRGICLIDNVPSLFYVYYTCI